MPIADPDRPPVETRVREWWAYTAPATAGLALIGFGGILLAVLAVVLLGSGTASPSGFAILAVAAGGSVYGGIRLRRRASARRRTGR